MNPVKVNYQEKRDYIRMDAVTHLTFQTEESQSVFNGTTINISASGVLFKTGHLLALNDEIQLTIAPATQQINPLIAKAVVTRLQPNAGDGHHVAVQIKSTT